MHTSEYLWMCVCIILLKGLTMFANFNKIIEIFKEKGLLGGKKMIIFFIVHDKLN